MDGEAYLICESSDLPESGDGIRFEMERGGERVPAFAIRYRGEVYAWVNRCAHVGVELDWLPGKFFDDSGLYLVCTTHGATYLPGNGRCVAGPCKGRALTSVPVFERNGRVYVKQDGSYG
jgi:nitrite reductase/ring-hydroxylating ferredoxin subunit